MSSVVLRGDTFRRGAPLPAMISILVSLVRFVIPSSLCPAGQRGVGGFPPPVLRRLKKQEDYSCFFSANRCCAMRQYVGSSSIPM